MNILSTVALGKMATSVKALSTLIKLLYWGADRYELLRLKKLVKTLSEELDDPDAGRKLIIMAYSKKHQERVGQLLNKARRAESVWITCCLAAVIANFMRQEYLNDDDAMIADALTNLSDQDLEVFVALKELADYENKVWQEKLPGEIENLRKSLQQHQVRFAEAKTQEDRDKRQQEILQSEAGIFELGIKRPSIRIDNSNFSRVRLKTNVSLQLVRQRVDRLVRSGALSGGLGGWGDSGFSHGMFVWSEFSDRFCDLVSRFEDYQTRPLKDLQ